MLGGVMFCLVLHCFAYVLQKTAVANVQPESARGGPKVLGGVQERNISKRQQGWELKNQLLAPYHCGISYSREARALRRQRRGTRCGGAATIRHDGIRMTRGERWLRAGCRRVPERAAAGC